MNLEGVRQLLQKRSESTLKPCVDQANDSQHDVTALETAMDILSEVGIESPFIIDILGPLESFDILFKSGEKYGC